MKKLVAIIMVAMLMLSFTGCSGIVNEFMEGFEEGYNDAVAQSKKDFVHGVIEGNVYTSEMSGLTFTAPETWKYMSDEELMDVMNEAYDSQDKNAFTTAASKMITISEMMAYDEYTGTNVIIVYENLALTGNAGISEEEYLEIAEENGAFDGMTIKGELAPATLSGQDVKFVEIENQGTTQYYYLMCLGDYMCMVTATAIGDVTRSEFETMFGA